MRKTVTETKTKPLYSVGTWDTDKQAYTPQAGIPRSINISLRTLRKVLKQLRQMGYSAHRKRNPVGMVATTQQQADAAWRESCERCEVVELPSSKGQGYEHDDNDWSVLVERTDGMTRKEILESWQR